MSTSKLQTTCKTKIPPEIDSNNISLHDSSVKTAHISVDNQISIILGYEIAVGQGNFATLLWQTFPALVKLEIWHGQYGVISGQNMGWPHIKFNCLSASTFKTGK